jgi:hypothetical protein
MDLTLPAAMYLLCYDPAKQKMGDDNALVRGQLLRAAAVADLCLSGLLTDRDGRAVRVPDAADPHDPFLAEVLDAVPEDRSKRWFGVVDARWHTAEGTVRDQLAAEGAISVERRRWLGMVPYRAAAPCDPEQLAALRARVRDVVLGGSPGAAPARDAALAIIAHDGDADTVFGRRERREHRATLRALGTRVDTELPGLRKALIFSIAARRTAAA